MYGLPAQHLSAVSLNRQPHHKPVDGHAPGLRGDDLTKYINAGISTDHECFTYDEGLEKLQKGFLKELLN